MEIDTIAYLELEIASQSLPEESEEVGNSWDNQAWQDIHIEIDREEEDE